jgi:ABC-type amino acid transport substrate-binding protein
MLNSLLLVILFHLFSVTALSQETTYKQASDTLVFGVEMTDYSPYYFINEEQRYDGAARDILDLFSNSLNKSVEYLPMPVPRLFHEFVKGKVDLKFPDNPLWSASLKADVKVFYSEPLFKVTESLLIFKQVSENPPENTSEEKITYVGTILGFSTPGIDQYVENEQLELLKANKVEQLIHMLAAKRVQGLFFNESVALKLARKMYPKYKLERHPNFEPFHYAYHLSSINHPEIIEAFNDFLVSHAEQVTEIRNRYGLE